MRYIMVLKGLMLPLSTTFRLSPLHLAKTRHPTKLILGLFKNNCISVYMIKHVFFICNRNYKASILLILRPTEQVLVIYLFLNFWFEK